MFWSLLKLKNICIDDKILPILKWYYDQKISSFFPSDFESVFTYRLTGKILSFEFYPKAVFF